MPKTYISAQDRVEALDARRNEAFIWALKTAKARLGKSYRATADAVGVSERLLQNLKEPEAVSNARFGSIRAIAHEIGMTREEWLRFGGFEK